MIWTAQNAQNLNALLKSTPLLAKLDELRPEYEGRTLEDKAMSASVREGYEECVKEIVALAAQATQPTIKSPFIENLDKFEQRPFGAES